MLNLNKKILFMIHSPLFAKGGHTKNFLNLIKFLRPNFEEKGYKLIICSFNHTARDINNERRMISQNSYLRKKQIILLKRTFPSVKFIYQILQFINNLFQTLFVLIKYNPYVVYAYGDKTLYLNTFLKSILRYKLVADIRGDAIDEREQQGYSHKKIFLLKKVNAWSRRQADKIFEVYNLSFNGKKNNKHITKYNYYDGSLFKYDKEKYSLQRKEIGLSGKFVFVYTGSTHYYQMVEEMIFFFSEFSKKHKNSHFLIISEFDENEFIKYFDKYNTTSGYYSIHKLNHENVNDLQIIADMAFLIRDDIPVNHHAFPTKFAEYLASGIPVLTTPHLHSIAPMVSKNNLGEVIETIKMNKNYNELIDAIYEKYKNNFTIKYNCASFARSELMWQKKAKEIFQIIGNL